MLGYAAIAQLALCEFPGGIAPTPPLPPPRPNPQGVVVYADVVAYRTYGTSPAVGAPFALFIYEPFIYTSIALVAGEITLRFTGPSGQVQLSDDRYVNVGRNNLLEEEQFSVPRYLYYQAAVGEFNQAGVWQVIVQMPNTQSAIYYFTIGAN